MFKWKVTGLGGGGGGGKGRKNLFIFQRFIFRKSLHSDRRATIIYCKYLNDEHACLQEKDKNKDKDKGGGGDDKKLNNEVAAADKNKKQDNNR